MSFAAFLSQPVSVWIYVLVPLNMSCLFFPGQIEKEEKRKENMMKARQFEAGYKQELELRRKEREEEE